MKKVDTILFDLDGTLIDTNEIILKSFESVFNKYVPEFEYDLETYKGFIGPSLYDSFYAYFKEEETIQNMIKHYRKFYVENEFDYFEIYPNVVEVIKELKKQGYNLGIVTTKFKEAAWPSFTHYGLEEYFDVFVALEDVEKPKPDREPVDKALSQLKHTGAIMVGDNQSDVLSGNNAGIYSCGVAWSFKGKENLLKVNPDFMIEDMKDLYEILEKLNA